MLMVKNRWLLFVRIVLRQKRQHGGEIKLVNLYVMLVDYIIVYIGFVLFFSIIYIIYLQIEPCANEKKKGEQSKN